MNSNTYIISIGGGEMQLSLINSIRKQGYGVIVVDKDINCPGRYKSDYFINKSTYDHEGIIDELEKIMDKFIFEAVMVKSSGKPVLTAAKIAERFNLEFPSVKASELTLDKNMLMNKMKQKGILCPKSFDKNGLRFPIIIKPRGGTGGKKCIFLAKDKSELYNIEKTRVFNAEDYEFEEYIEGNDCTFFAAIKNKKIKWYTIIDELNKFELDKDNNFSIRGLGFSIPSIYTSTKLENIISDVSKKIIDVLKINTAIVWISYRINNDKPYLIEIHLDLAGEYLLDKLMSYYTENNLIDEIVSLYTGSECFDINNGNDGYTILFDNCLIKKIRNEYGIENINEIESDDIFSIFRNIPIDNI